MLPVVVRCALLPKVAEVVDREWLVNFPKSRWRSVASPSTILRRRSRRTSNPEWYHAITKNGAIGGELIGTGFGGFLTFYAEEKERLRRTLREAGMLDYVSISKAPKSQPNGQP